MPNESGVSACARVAVGSLGFVVEQLTASMPDPSSAAATLPLSLNVALAM
jgi:hypothetical protein